MSKKMNEINDIIDSAYTVADYSHGGGYYDKASEHGNRRNIYSSIPYHREHNGNSNSNGNSNGNNIFLKNSQIVNTNTNTNGNTNTTGTNTGININKSCDEKKLVLNDDNFPSLGCKPDSINKSSKIENKLDFKKMVEKKPIVITKPTAPPLQNSATNNRFKSNQFSLYNEIKERSEKIAQNKMIDEISSDDEI